MDFFEELAYYIKENKPSKKELSAKKIELCSKYKMKRIPTDIEVLLSLKNITELKHHLITKPTRTLSGIAAVAVMTRPHKCPHGKCTMCPGGVRSAFGDTPQSYTGTEPAAMRGARNNYDPYLQVFNRLEQYIILGQNPEKVELIVMGGTFLSTPPRYQEEFVMECFKAMNDFGRMFMPKGELDIEKFKEFFELPRKVSDVQRLNLMKSKISMIKTKSNLVTEHLRNEKSSVRCVGLTIETRPDYALEEHANQMLRLGCTRVELGVQSVFDKALQAIKRGHDVQSSKKAIATLKDFGFKINAHMMVGLPGVKMDEDLAGLKELFTSEDFRPDMMKIYPCMVLKGTAIYEDWKKGAYKPLNATQAARIISDFKQTVPPYVRIMRVQRDIPTKTTADGVEKTNLRQLIQQQMQADGTRCGCIRCREIKGKQISTNPEIKVLEYHASGSPEYFISFECEQGLIGFCRLRFPNNIYRPEITTKSAIIRELHVYGTAQKIGTRGSVQHAGFGRALMNKAEVIAREAGKDKMVVISGVGVRGYYRKLGYRRQGPYMVRKLG